MNNKLLFLTTALFIFLISFTSVNASYIYGPDLYPVNPSYLYYKDYENIPIVTGPFPREYLFHRDMGKDIDFVIDDFGHFDEFIGYKDLDLFYPEQGIIHVIRNPSSRELDLSHIPEGMKTFGNHVYGYIPGPDGSCVMYRKHYHHEHPWDLNVDYGYGYYTPFLAYRNKPIQRQGCQQISACEYRRCYYDC
nr:hypothetical protein [Nanoarchaeota archaeon]